MNLMYITNEPSIANIAQECGIEWIFIDLEINGKEERQGHLDTVISRHNIEDIKKVKKVLNKSELLVRVNPIYSQSKEEIDRVINDGADIVMLPYFRYVEEIEKFIQIVDERAKVCLLCETAEAVKNIDDILKIDKIDMIHIGLNDLHLEYQKSFMFELLTDGTVEKLCKKFKERNIEYGFGGIAPLGNGELSVNKIIGEHVRLGSNMAILSRGFRNSLEKSKDIESKYIKLHKQIQEIRNIEAYWKEASENELLNNKQILKKRVNEIAIKK